jgi:hypothetical protein
MTTITFDTLKYVERLKAAGVPEPHAKAEAEALADVLSSGARELATKADLRDAVGQLRHEMQEQEMRIVKWLVGIATAQIALLIGILIKLL